MSNSLRLALAQMAVSEDLAANRQKGLDWVGQAAKHGAQMLCFTELGLLPFFPQYRTEKKFFQWAEPIDGPTVKKFGEVAERKRIHILLNFFERAGAGEYYDTTVLLKATGSPALGPVRMMHIAEEPCFNEKFYYWPGNTPPQVFDLDGVKVGVAICYDRHFPEYTRQLVLQGAEIIFAPFAGIVSDPIPMYEIEMQGLAFQNQVFVAAVNRVGKEATVEFAGCSFAVDPAGEVIARAPRGEEKLLLVDCDLSRIEAMRQVRPFLRDRRPEIYESWLKRK
ncbi:MAG: carbon-nitrogen hydrolase family protein [candidate division KSB1 bacterium]|nr:carbon-nitrogen hydrolase family protein [candidate division KSB1 bacterium]MDZ7304285.1 carbon-nitrogen hydrolase family protein [candidate division KSB1 bacterium]MDZ7312916.1 carbon-nitrogen hydrolase family protein [candidate division KSB1 bacterium]